MIKKELTKFLALGLMFGKAALIAAIALAFVAGQSIVLSAFEMDTINVTAHIIQEEQLKAQIPAPAEKPAGADEKILNDDLDKIKKGETNIESLATVPVDVSVPNKEKEDISLSQEI